jgi:hypothetical protein
MEKSSIQTLSAERKCFKRLSAAIGGGRLLYQDIFWEELLF